MKYSSMDTFYKNSEVQYNPFLFHQLLMFFRVVLEYTWHRLIQIFDILTKNNSRVWRWRFVFVGLRAQPEVWQPCRYGRANSYRTGWWRMVKGIHPTAHLPSWYNLTLAGPHHPRAARLDGMGQLVWDGITRADSQVGCIPYIADWHGV